MSFADSAGVPWEGRSFSENAFAQDDGKELPEITAALKAFSEANLSFDQLINSFRQSRVLIPLVPKAEGKKIGQHGLSVDTSSEMNIVALEGPDGHPALPIFTSAENVMAWKSEARPVPAQFERALLAAAAEGQTRVVVNPGQPNWFAIRRPAIEALAQQQHWTSPDRDERVKALVSAAIKSIPVEGFRLLPGDPTGQLEADELIVYLKLQKDLTKDQLQEIVPGFLSSLDYQNFNPLVDSLKITLVS